MLFPTLDYLVFLTVTVGAYWLLPRAARMPLLGVASLLFYASWNPAYLPVLLGMTAGSWLLGMWVGHRLVAGRPASASAALSVVLLTLPLVLFKYWGFLAENVEAAGLALGLPLDLPRLGLALPIGLSFFTFEALSYVIDVKRGDAPEREPLRYSTFITFFPHLIAGPILRPRELLPQLRALPLLHADQVGGGLYRIGLGMAKKILVADVIKLGMVDPLFSDPERFTGLELLLALYAYTLQIYYDFSAYTDIAIGSAALFGISLPENFRRPYKATTVAAFWRRWHITLSDWVKDYVYFPMGGARVAEWKVYRNLMLTLLIIGVWHGASWNFVVYGLLHGAAVCLNRWLRKRSGRRPEEEIPGVWAWTWRFLLTFHFVVFARVLFRADTLGGAWDYLVAMADTSLAMPRFSHSAWLVFLVAFALHFTPDRWELRLREAFVARGPLVWALVLGAVAWATVTFGTGESLSFIYYQF